MAPVHGHQIDVHVNEEIGLGDTAVDPDPFTQLGFAELNQAIRVLAVVAVEPVRVVRIEDRPAYAPADFKWLHAPVEGIRDHNLEVIDPRGVKHCEELGED